MMESRSYILDLMRGAIEPHPDRITLDRYVLESSYVTRYLSRLVKDQALVLYHVLFMLSWFETGRGQIVIPWARAGSFIRSTHGNMLDYGRAVKRRLPDLIQQKCVAVNRQRGSANEISVHLPSDIPACRMLIEQEEAQALVTVDTRDERDYYNEPGRRLEILTRDGGACVYCTMALSEEDFVIDHLLPVAKGGTNRKHNLVSACEACNRRRSESDPIEFLRDNYRQQLLTQDEFLRQKSYIEKLLGQAAG